jgi:hypothetical protein
MAEPLQNAPPAADPVYENVLFSGELPGAVGSVPLVIQAQPLEAQRQQALDYFTFLTAPESQMLQFNADTLPRTALLHLCGTSMVKLVYGIGMGASGIGSTSPIDNKILMLTGDGNATIGPPAPLVLPPQMREAKEMPVMTHQQFETTLKAKGNGYSWPLISNTNVTARGECMQLAPIPSYLVYDGFSTDIDAAEVYERVLSVDTDNNLMYDHLKRFLRACLSTHVQGNNRPSVSIAILIQPAPNEAKTWARKKFKTSFPTLMPADTPQNHGLPADLATALAAFLPAAAGLARAPAPTQEEEKKDEGTVCGMSTQECEMTLEMCGLNVDSDPELLPTWIKSCAAKGMNEQYKLILIRKHIMSTTYYDDAEVPLTSQLIKMVMKRSWVGKDGNVRFPSLINALEGLSPFLCVAMEEDFVAEINATEDALTQASYVSVQDIQKAKKALKISIPSDEGDFLLLLKSFANLLFALFSESCPFFLAMKRIITSYRALSRPARKAMSHRSKASILWIILLQSRKFAIGEMEILSEFSGMHTSLTQKSGIIMHAELPLELAEEPKKQNAKTSPKRQVEGDPKKSDPPAKKPKPNPNTWHPKLKAAFTEPLRIANKPTFTSILRYCDEDSTEIYAKNARKCAPNAFFGTCYGGDACPRDHSMATDAEATKIIKMCDKFIKNPSELNRGP